MSPPVRGARVSVPLGRRVVTGIVVGDAGPVVGASDPANSETKIKDLIAVLDDAPFVPPAVVDLAMWVAEYYACGPGDALAAAMPPAKTQNKTILTVRL